MNSCVACARGNIWTVDWGFVLGLHVGLTSIVVGLVVYRICPSLVMNGHGFQGMVEVSRFHTRFCLSRPITVDCWHGFSVDDC